MREPARKYRVTEPADFVGQSADHGWTREDRSPIEHAISKRNSSADRLGSSRSGQAGGLGAKRSIGHEWGKIFAPEEVDGSKLTSIADSWEGKILTTSITDGAERIEKGVAFPVTIPAHLKRARIEVMVNGLPLGGSLKVWLNGQVVGTLSFEVPDLTDPGYGEENNDQFAGWRKGVLLLPPTRLNVGDNQFQFEGPAGTPLAIRDFLLQVQYAVD